MLNEQTNWARIVSSEHFIHMSEKDLKMVLKFFDIEILGNLYRKFQADVFGVYLRAEKDFRLPNDKYTVCSQILFDEIKERIDGGDCFAENRYSGHDFKLYERCQRYIIKCRNRKSVMLYEWMQKHAGIRSNPFFGVYEREPLISNLETTKRSDGYMQKRYDYISAIVCKGLMELDDTNTFPRKLSKSFREQLLHKCIHVAHCLTQNIQRYEKLDEKNGMIYFMTIEETKRQRKYALMMCIELLPNWFSNYTVKGMISSLKKEDLSYIMPMLAVKECSATSKSDLMKEIKRLLVEK